MLGAGNLECSGNRGKNHCGWNIVKLMVSIAMQLRRKKQRVFCSMYIRAKPPVPVFLKVSGKETSKYSRKAATMRGELYHSVACSCRQCCVIL